MKLTLWIVAQAVCALSPLHLYLPGSGLEAPAHGAGPGTGSFRGDVEASPLIGGFNSFICSHSSQINDSITTSFGLVSMSFHATKRSMIMLSK